MKDIRDLCQYSSKKGISRGVKALKGKNFADSIGF